jgi:hypothetical protein
VEYCTKADDYQRSIRTKLTQAGVTGRPSAPPLPWFDLQVCCAVTVCCAVSCCAGLADFFVKAKKLKDR